jgi:DNA-directed RNA polymerase specialized sigma24 family protein
MCHNPEMLDEMTFRTSASLLEKLRLTPGQENWTRFVKLYTPLLFFWARKLGLRDADAADLVQDVLAIVVQKFPPSSTTGKKASGTGCERSC